MVSFFSTKFQFNKKIFLFVILFSFLTRTVFAVGPFLPGTEDNPQCLPSDINCDVLPSLTTEVDPIFTTSSAFGITGTDISKWNSSYVWGNHANAGYLTSIIANNLYLGIGATASNSSLLENHNAAYFQTALGFTPYNATNPNGYISGINSSNVTTALGFTPYDSTNPAGYISSYTETDPTIYAWAKTATKPSYTSNDVGLGNVPNLSFSGSNTGDETNSTIKTKLGSASISTDGYLTSTDWDTFNGKQSTLSSGTNIKTINGNSILGSGDLVISGSMVYPDSGIPVSNGSGWGTSIVNNSANWDTAYSWGNHASAGYLTSTDLSSYVKIQSSGNVGIGTITPSALLSLQSVLSNESATLGNEITTTANWTSTDWTGDYTAGFSHTTGNTTPLSRTMTTSNNQKYQVTWTVTGRTTGTFTISIGTVISGSYFTSNNWGPTVAGNGNLIFTPTTDFNGTISNISVKLISAAAPSVFNILDNTGVSNFEIRSSLNTLNNAFIGKGAGRYNTTGYQNVSNGSYSLFNNTTGYQNLANGYNALALNTTGYNNVSNGSGTLSSNTTGYQNVANGSGSLSSNTTGYQNIGNGSFSLQSNTTGHSNVGNGYNALALNTTGYQNVANGISAGRYIANGTANQTSFNSVYEGANTRASANGVNNEVVIGYSAIGNGSNTVTLGNLNNINNYLFGDITINSSDLGNGLAGRVIILGRNTNATNTGAGSINFLNKVGTAGYVWQDAAGNMRINTSAPTNSLDTSGVVIGTQTSTRDTKQDIANFDDYNSALNLVLSAPLHNFRYINEVKGYGESSPLAKVRIGYIADEVDPIFMTGNSIDQVSVNGLLIASIKAMDLKINNTVSEQKSFLEKLYENIAMWLGSSNNNLEKICMKKTDGSTFCVNADQLEKVVNSINQAPNQNEVQVTLPSQNNETQTGVINETTDSNPQVTDVSTEEVITNQDPILDLTPTINETPVVNEAPIQEAITL